MPLAWEQKKKLARLTGVMVEIARIPAAGGGGPEDNDAVGSYLDELGAEVGGAFSPDGDLAQEFDRLFQRDRSLPPQIRAAAVAGWLKELLAADAHDAAELEGSMLPDELSRKVSVGFKLRSPIVRDEQQERRS
jgi:hypothetical protein